MNIKNIVIDRHLLLYIISYLTLIDILFIPYFSYLIMPYSLPVVLLSLFLFINVKKDKNAMIFLIIYLMVLLSTLMSVYLNYQPEYIIENLKRAFQFLSTFVYFFYYYYVFREIKPKLKPIFFTFTLYILILVVIFIVNPLNYFELRVVLYPLNVSSLGEFLFFGRFDYMFSDPNTAGYFIILALFFLLFNFKLNVFSRIIVLITIILTTISIKSLGVTLSAIILLLIYIIFLMLNIRKRLTKMNVLGFVILPFILIIIPVFSYNVNLDSLSQLSDEYIERIEMSGINNESRKVKYMDVINEFYPSIIGTGYIMLNEGKVVKPHNDHLRMIYSYGIICYLSLLYLFFRKTLKLNSIVLIPAFVAFSINTLIDEQKLFALFLIILAYIHVQNDKSKEYNSI